MDKTQAMVSFLQTCPSLTNNTQFFNFGTVENNAHQLITRQDDVNLQRPYIDGSVLKRYTFIIDSFKSVGFTPIVSGLSDENMDDFADVQKLLDWVNEQNDLRNYPDFGESCFIDEMKTTSSKPELLGVDNQKNPPVAIYRVTIQIDYLDNSKRIW